MWNGVGDQTYSRRGLLRRGLAGAAACAVASGPLAGCGLFGLGEPDPPDPLDPLLAATVALAARYDAAIAAQPQLADLLTPLRNAHAAHAEALARLIGRPASSLSPSPPASTTTVITDAATTLTELRTAEQTAQKEAAAACLDAVPERTAVLGSMAAARATHQEVLK